MLLMAKGNLIKKPESSTAAQ